MNAVRTQFNWMQYKLLIERVGADKGEFVVRLAVEALDLAAREQ